ncbi:MAG: carboxypeptidase regulatory-like domain-containing protein, partial [Acidobacteriaceae bacterium]|nr:carboxypeptidase regulatory-like domain-containing protein [Acidobacteriaceae bacterium]
MPAPDRPFCLTDSILCSAGRAALPFRARRLSRAGACLLLLLAACAMPIQAQTTVDGALRGTVMDTQSAVIPAATLHLRNAATAVDRTALSSPDGAFFFARVPAGEYTLSAESPGFARQTADHVLIELGSVSTIALHLAPAGAVVAVHVNAEDTAPTLDEPQSAATASVVRQNEIEQFPLKDRRWQSLALLTPVASPGSGGDSLLSFRGLAITQNRTSIDGMSDDQRFNNVPRGTSAEPVEEDSAEQQQEPGGVGLNRGAGRRSGISSTFSAEAVREFRIASQNQSALYGRGIGGSITTITRSGSNHLHGSAFYNARSSAWAATNPFSIATSYNNGAPATTMVKPRDLRQQFGGSLGGPVLHDRLFFFYAFDQQHRADVAISSPADPAFYSLTATQNALLGNRGVGTAQIGAALSYLDLLTGEVGRSSNRSIHFGKLDWQAGAKHRFSAQYNRVRYRAPAGLRSSAVVDRGTASLGNAYVSVDAALARWLWTISPSFIHELRFAYGRDLQYQTPQQPLPQEPAIGPGGYAPEVAIGPQGLTFGTPAALGRRAWPDERRAQVADLASWQHRRHFVQFGFDVSFVHDLIDALNNTEGTYHYDSGTTNGRAGGLVDWITDYTFNVNAYPNGGCPAIYASIHYFCFRSYTQSFGEPAVSFNTAELAGFAEYSWRVSRRLSFHAGVRYDYEIVPSPQRPNPELDAIFGQTGATSVFPEDRNNIGPRIGFAWQPFGAKSGVIRAGYGIYYGSVPGATIQSALVNTALPSSTSSIRITPSTVTNCPQVENQGFGYACSYLTTPPAAVSQTTTATVFDHRFRLPMVQQATLAIEREIGAGIVAS